MTGSKILAMGHYQPSRVLTNDDLAQMVETNDAWIRDRVGIATRRIADTETVADMAAAAAGKALANSGLTAADIDLVIVATCSSVDRCPNVATRVAAKLGIAAPGAYDINTACSGFCYALASADHAIRAGAARNVIVIGAEKLSDFTDWTDRSTAVIFGDGAGAAVVTRLRRRRGARHRPGALGLRARRRATSIQIEGWRPYIQQAGQAVFRWATFALPTLAKRGLRAGRHRPERARPRSCRTRPTCASSSRSRASSALTNAVVVAKDIVESGNTSAASIPLALSKLLERREVPSGAPVLLFGFGGGLTYAGQVVRCP